MCSRYSIPLAVLASLLPTALLAQGGEGHQLTDRMIRRAETTVREIALTRWHVREAVDAHNALINESGDLRAAYRNLERQIRRTERQLASTRQAADRMQASADDFFGDWAKSLEKMADEELRARAFGRMNGTRERYDEILALGRQAREEFDGFISLLRDKLVFTGHDLNPEALGELRQESDRFNEQAEALRRKIDRTIGTANRYIDALRPQ